MWCPTSALSVEKKFKIWLKLLCDMNYVSHVVSTIEYRHNVWVALCCLPVCWLSIDWCRPQSVNRVTWLCDVADTEGRIRVLLKANPATHSFYYLRRTSSDAHQGSTLAGPFNGIIKTAEQRNNILNIAIRWWVHWLLIGGLLHLVQQGWAWAGCGPTQAIHIIRCGTIIATAL